LRQEGEPRNNRLAVPPRMLRRSSSLKLSEDYRPGRVTVEQLELEDVAATASIRLPAGERIP
jgi:hypothetical protein